MRQSSYKHIAIGSRIENSKVTRIIKPTDESAYLKTWTGSVRFENPKWYDIELEDGRIFRDCDVQPQVEGIDYE